MKQDRLLKHMAIAFAAALVIYFTFYFGIEHRRTRKGPWEIKFICEPATGTPRILINQPALGIRDVMISFPGEIATPTNATIVFKEPRPTPCDLPFGKCIFMDLTFLPGTVVLDMFGHEIQLIPRVLTIDNSERPWRSNAGFDLSPSSRKPQNGLPDSRTPPAEQRNP